MSVGGYEVERAGDSAEMSLSDSWALMRRRQWYVILPVVVAVGVSLALSLSTTPMYRATADVLIEAGPEVGQVSGEEAVLNNTVSNELVRARGAGLQDDARSEVGDEPELAVTRADDGDVLLFSAESRSARRAAEAANAYADTYVAERQRVLAGDFEAQAEVLQGELEEAQRQLEGETSQSSPEAADLRLRIADLRSQIEEGKTAARIAVERGASVVNIAERPDAPFAPRPLRSAIVALMIGLFVGLAAAFVRDFMDNNIRVPEGLERATRLPVSAVIPRLKNWKKNETHVVVVESPTTPQAEAYRALRARIQFRRVDTPIRTILVTSPRPGEGKTTTSTNLAVAFAAAGENTLLVDLDLRRPRVHKFFPINNDVGVSTVLQGAGVTTAIRRWTAVPNLSILPAGPPTDLSSELLNTDRLGQMLQDLSSRFDAVVVDTPPVLAVADPLAVSRHVDGVLLVVSASGTHKRDAQLASSQLAEVQAPMIGAVLNNYDASGSGYSYSYAYSDYGSTSSSTPTKGLATSVPGGAENSLVAEPTARPESVVAQETDGIAPTQGPADTVKVAAVSEETANERSSSNGASIPARLARPQPVDRVDTPPPASVVDPAPLVDPASVADPATGVEREAAPVVVQLSPFQQPMPTRSDASDGDTPNAFNTSGETQAPIETDSDVVEMTPSEFQAYLRSELRRAREEHTRVERPTGVVKTIKVVMVPDE